MNALASRILRSLLRLGNASPLLSAVPVLFLASFLAVKAALVLFASASLEPTVVLELGVVNPLPRVQRFALAVALVGINGYLHYRGGRRAIGVSLVPTVLSLVGLAWGSFQAGGGLDRDAPLRLGLFSALAVVAVADHGRLLQGLAGPGQSEPGGQGLRLPFPSLRFHASSTPLETVLGTEPEVPPGTPEPLPAAVPPARAAMTSEEELLEDLITFFEGPGQPGAPGPAAEEEADRALRELEQVEDQPGWDAIAPGLSNPESPMVCPVCNTINPPYRSTCALCEQPLHLTGEDYMNCPDCGVAFPRRAGRCFACGVVFNVRRVEEPSEVTLNLISLESLGDQGSVGFIHFKPEEATITYLLRTPRGYDLVTLVLGPGAPDDGAGALGEDEGDPEAQG